MNGRMEDIKKDTEKLKDDLQEVDKGGKMRFEKVEERLKKIEEEKDKSDSQKRKREVVAKENVERIEPAGIQPTGSTYKDKLCSQNKDGDKTKETHQMEFKSTWAKEMHEESLQKQLEKAHEDAARMDDQQKSERKERSGARSRSRVKKLKLGNSQELHNENDWPWDMSETDWEGTEDRQEREGKEEKEGKKREGS